MNPRPHCTGRQRPTWPAPWHVWQPNRTGVHWLAEDDKKIQDYNYQAVKESIKRAVSGSPTAAEVVSKKGSAAHPFAAHL